MSDIIQLLPDHVANQIAAGEVVQRPASVVKELLENAIDANADAIQLLIKDAGKTLIQVSDNGTGMSATDARLSFERHATSKIKSAEDLFKLSTKGFRGEALASIAAVSHVNLKSKQVSDETGTEIIIKGSEVVSQEPCVTPKGTVINIKNLFFNIPARRNFLKSDRVELRHIIDEFHRVALAHPQIAFSMQSNDSQLFKLPKSNSRQRIVNVFGKKTNEKLVPVEENTEVIKIKGFVGKPEYAKRSKGEQFFFVNNRFIKNAYMHHAVTAAYEGLLERKKYPSYFLFFEINPQSIDINIHPTKTEIKFDDDQAIYAILRSAIKHSLGQFNVSPSLDFKRDADLDTPYNYKHKDPEIPKIEVDRNFNPFADEKPGKSQFKPSFKPKKEADWEGLYTGLNNAQNADNFSSIEFESEAVTGSLFDKEPSQQSDNIFQLGKKYIVGALKGGMVVIHQHRAHYRILYEKFLKNITIESTVSQQLLFPLQIELSTKEIGLLKDIIPILSQTGFDFDEINNHNIKISGIPSIISENEIPRLLDNLIAELEQGIPNLSQSNSERLANILAENTAIKTGTLLNKEEQLSIINQLFACKEPKLTPSNKQVFIELDARDLDKNF